MPPKRDEDPFDDDFEDKSTRELLIATRRDVAHLTSDLSTFMGEIKVRLGDCDVKIRALELYSARAPDFSSIEKRLHDAEEKIANAQGGSRWTDYLIMAAISAAIGLIFRYGIK